MKTTKTTNKHFEIFKKECEKWVDFFGLKEWDLKMVHEDCGDSNGKCLTGYSSKSAIITLTTEYECDGELIHSIKKTAFHEVVHLLLADLVALGRARYLESDEFENKEHEIVSKLINSVFKHVKL